jgi:RHS repeat-associated protein
VSLADVMVKLPATDLTVTVSGKGAVVIGKETREPALANVARRRTEAQRAPQAVAVPAAASSSVIGMLGISPFKGAPFVEPMTGDIYMRDRWYNPHTGTFLSPDPEGYAGSANLYSYCHGDPVNCSDPTGRRAMTAEDKRHLATLRARGKKLHYDFTSAGRAAFNQYLLVPVDRPWSDTSGPIGGDYTQQLVPSMVTTQSAYEASRRSMVNDVATFEAAVARADENGEIYYNAGIGFTTITAADRKGADRATMVAAGVFFATDEVPIMLSPYTMRGQVFEPARTPLEIGKALPATALEFGANDLVYGTSSGGRLRSLQQEAGGVLLSDMYRHKPAGMSWTEFSYRTMDQAAATGRPIRFDLTNVGDIENVLNNRGPYANAVTAHELRYLRQNWSRFERNVFFYKNGVEVGMPWE